jgi:LmbE family N-acetylglucosaminyl deacetylase
MAPPVASANIIYLSPHYDDAAFSVGAWIATHPGGLLVNLFTRSEFTATEPARTVAEVSAMRAAEDQVFAERFGLDVVALELEEPSLRGRKSRDATSVDDDIGQLRAPLFRLLDERWQEGNAIFCPAAIGGHVNHLATRLTACEWAVARGRESCLRFYEDLPYASRPHLRRRGVAALRAALIGWHLRREAWPASPAKLGLIGLYPSQLDRPPTLRRFSPATLWPLGWHEAVWRMGR